MVAIPVTRSGAKRTFWTAAQLLILESNSSLVGSPCARQGCAPTLTRNNATNAGPVVLIANLDVRESAICIWSRIYDHSSICSQLRIFYDHYPAVHDEHSWTCGQSAAIWERCLAQPCSPLSGQRILRRRGSIRICSLRMCSIVERSLTCICALPKPQYRRRSIGMRCVFDTISRIRPSKLDKLPWLGEA